MPFARSWWAEDRWSSIAAAAILMIAAVVAAVSIDRPAERSSFAGARRGRPPADVRMDIEAELVDAGFDAAGTLTGQGDRFVAAGENPIATLPIGVSKASYVH